MPRCRLGLGLVVLCVLTGTAWIRTAKGHVYFLEFDFPRQPELVSIAGVFWSRVSFAAGFHAVCDRVAFFHGEEMVVPPVEKQAGKTRISPQEVHDVVRRELRAIRVLTAWLNHDDTRDNLTLSMWIPTGEERAGCGTT